MVGVLSYGAYVPIYRLSREELAKVWGDGSRKGERAVAYLTVSKPVTGCWCSIAQQLFGKN